MKARQIAVVLCSCGILISLPALTAAQQSGRSLAEAARTAKEQQKQAPKAKMIWTNDNLPTARTVSVVGQVQQPENITNANEAPAQAQTDGSAREDVDSERTKATAELADAQKQLDSLKTDLDIAQREYKLDSDQYYATPDYSADQQGQAKLNSDKSQIATKQQAVDAAQKKVDELQKEIDSLDAKPKN